MVYSAIRLIFICCLVMAMSVQCLMVKPLSNRCRISYTLSSSSNTEIADLEGNRTTSTVQKLYQIAPPRRKAQWLPFGADAPAVLDGSLAADVGFDPFRIVKSKRGLYWMREAEVKHARLAMLAAVGWPLSELLHKEIAQTFGLQSILASGDRAPALLNGGLDNTWATGMLMMSIIIAGILEGRAMNSGEIFWASEKPEGYVPGNLGFDPLGLYNARGDKKSMEAAEIKNGRLAMIAVTSFVFLEATTKMPVVQLTPFLF